MRSDEQAPTVYWTFVEQAIAILCACLPTLRVLFLNMSLGRLLDSVAKKAKVISKDGMSSKTRYKSLDEGPEGIGDLSSLDGKHGSREPLGLSDLELDSIHPHSSSSSL